jgi:hypothetical protein
MRIRVLPWLVGLRLDGCLAAISLRIVFTPRPKPPLPKDAIPDPAWSQLRYSMYPFVQPP